MSFIHRAVILALIVMGLQVRADFIQEICDYKSKMASSIISLDLSTKPEYDYAKIPSVSGIAILLDLHGRKRTVFELITVGLEREYLRKIGLTKPHIDAIIDAREKPTKDKLIKLGLIQFEMEIFNCTATELDRMDDLLSFVQKNTILEMQKASKDFAATKIQRKFRNFKQTKALPILKAQETESGEKLVSQQVIQPEVEKSVEAKKLIEILVFLNAILKEKPKGANIITQRAFEYYEVNTLVNEKKLPKKVRQLLFELAGFTIYTYGTGYIKKINPKEVDRWKFRHFDSWEVELARAYAQNNTECDTLDI